MASGRMLSRCSLLAVCWLLAGLPLLAQEATPLTAADSPAAGATAGPVTPTAFDPVAATNAYLATVSGEKRARSDAYFEGGYWLQQPWDNNCFSQSMFVM